MKMKFFGLALILFVSANVFAQWNPAQTDVDSMCNVSAYIIDKDSKGLNVRSGAGSKSKAIGKIPYNADGTVVDIIGSKGDWVKIENARTAANDSVFSKTGWVYAPLLAISTRNSDGAAETVDAYEMPSTGNDIVAKLPVFKEYKLAGCFEGWIKITIPQKSGSIPGWLPSENQCDLPWTNCS
jgi:SH3-like domain-containing protein